MPDLKVQTSDVDRIAENTLLSFGPHKRDKRSQFWILLSLAGVIATAGVVNDSTATVIGAMIVAPLMTPILGTAFALVMSNRHYLGRSLVVVLGGALLVIAIGFVFGLIDPTGTVAEGNSQVSSRVHPRLIDLIAALATGLVGAFALVRADVADTLPGVAISISLVPPLAVAGIVLEEGKYGDALGAVLLFTTNVTAIIFTATLVLLLYKVRDTAKEAGYHVGELTGKSLAVVVAAVMVVAIPLAYGSQRILQDQTLRLQAAPVAKDWADANQWRVINLSVDNRVLSVVALGPPPSISGDTLRAALDEQGFSDLDLVVDLIVGGSQEYPAADS